METISTTEAAATRKSKRRIRTVLFRGALALIVAAIVAAIAAHLSWKYSGSNEWKQVGERKEVILYSLKTPGSSIEKFRAVWKIRSRLSQFVMWASDTDGDTEHSMRRETGLYDHRVLGQQGDRVTWSAWKQPLVSFLEPREFVIKSEFSQNPETKALVYTVTGVPDRIPPDDCCVRVPVMNNRWTLTPLKTGEVEVEWFVDMDIGGAVPYVLQNKVQPGGMLNFAPRVEQFLQQEKYKNARYNWVEDAQP